jgi:hypothetical protein
MPTFDANAAKAAGYSDAEISLFMAQQGQNNQAMQHAPGLTQQNVPLPNDPTNGMSPGQLLAAGAGRGVVHTARSLGNLIGLVPNSTLANEKQIDAPLLATRAGETGNIAGEAAATAPLTMGAGAALGSMGRLGAGLMANPITSGALQGGIQGLATSDPGERGANAALGATTGAGLNLLGTGISKLARGLSRTPEANLLLKQGVDLTPGQLNPAGPMNQFEQASESVPGVKQIIHGARDNAEQGYQRAIIQKAAVPGTTITPSENIHEMLTQAYDSYAPLYNQAKGFPVRAGIVSPTGTVPLSTAFDQAVNTPGVTDQAKSAAKSWLDNELSRLPPNPDSADLLKVRSNIRSAARAAKLATDTLAQDKAAIFSNADDQVTSALQSQLPQHALDALQRADSQYGTYKIVENAVAKSRDNVAGLTPQKLSQAVYDATDNPAYARGAGGDLRDLAKAGTSVFQTVSPPTGARVLTLGGAVGLGALSPPAAIAGGTGLLGLVGTKTGRSLAAGTTAPQRGAQVLADALSKYTPDTVKALAGRAATGAAMPYTPQALTTAAALAQALRKKPETTEQNR